MNGWSYLRVTEPVLKEVVLPEGSFAEIGFLNLQALAGLLDAEHGASWKYLEGNVTLQ